MSGLASFTLVPLAALTALRRFDLLEECFGAGPRDGTERFDHLIAAHADAVVLDGQELGLGIERHGNVQLHIVAQQRRIGNRLIAQPLAGIGRIGDQLA